MLGIIIFELFILITILVAMFCYIKEKFEDEKGMEYKINKTEERI